MFYHLKAKYISSDAFRFPTGFLYFRNICNKQSVGDFIVAFDINFIYVFEVKYKLAK